MLKQFSSKFIKLIAIVITGFSQIQGNAQISLPKVFSHNMVLQRGMPIPVWGKAAKGATVIASMGKLSATTVADSNGNWKVKLPKAKAGGPYVLTVSEKGKPHTTIQLENVLIGDVWIASGQSNMEWPVQQAQNAQEEIGAANFPQIRFLIVPQKISLTPKDDIAPAGWKVCDSETVSRFSAVAYYFSRRIHQDQQVPIGIIQTAWGGTPIEAWTSREQLLKDDFSKASVITCDTITEMTFVRDSLEQLHRWDIVYNSKNNISDTFARPTFSAAFWPQVYMPATLPYFGIGTYDGMMWFRKSISIPASWGGKPLTISIGHPEMNYSIYFNGQLLAKSVWHSVDKHVYTIPAQLVQNGDNIIALRVAMLWGGGGIKPPAEDLYITDGATKISLAGQWAFSKETEPRFPTVHEYQHCPTFIFNAMVHPLIPYGIKGAIWYQGESNTWAAYHYRTLFPMLINDWRSRWKQGEFPFLFVQLANFKKKFAEPTQSDWAELREAQAMTLSLPNTGMACSIDIGEADNIHPLNKQDVGFRLALQANKIAYGQKVTASGPTFKSYQIENNKIKIWFANAEGGLKAADNKAIMGFAIAGADQQFHWAKATINGNTVILQSDKVANPVAVRYAWADNPDCNLVNKEGLPAVPFRTDRWKGITQQ